MGNYAEFLLNSPSVLQEFETVQIFHPNFTREYWIVSNHTDGLTATLETGVEANFEFHPLAINPSNSSSDLDFSLGLQFGDLGEILPNEIDSVRESNGFLIKPVITYRSFRSDNLNEPMTGPIALSVDRISFNEDNAIFESSATRANLRRTGLFYRTNNFPTLVNF